MDKKEFLSALEARLAGLPEADLQASLDFYAEMLDDLTEGGMTEAEAVASLGSVDAIAEGILMDTPLPKLIKAKMKPKRRMRAWEIVLIAVGFVEKADTAGKTKGGNCRSYQSCFGLCGSNCR